MANTFRLIHAARWVVDEVNLLADGRPRLLYEDQLRSAAQSIAANIREAYGRHPGKERNVFLRYARGSAEETDEHLRANFRGRRIPEKRFYALHNRIAVIVKMLDALMEDGGSRLTG